MYFFPVGIRIGKDRVVIEAHELIFGPEFGENGKGYSGSCPIVLVVVIPIGAVCDSAFELFPIKGPVVREDI